MIIVGNCLRITDIYSTEVHFSISIDEHSIMFVVCLITTLPNLLKNPSNLFVICKHFPKIS